MNLCLMGQTPCNDDCDTWNLNAPEFSLAVTQNDKQESFTIRLDDLIPSAQQLMREVAEQVERPYAKTQPVELEEMGSLNWGPVGLLLQISQWTSTWSPWFSHLKRTMFQGTLELPRR